MELHLFQQRLGRHLFVACVCVMLVLWSFVAVLAQDIILDVGQEEPKGRWLALPFAFPAESLGTAYGVAGGTSGYFQPQMGTFVAVLGSTNESYATYLVFMDFQIPFFRRLFIDFKGSAGYFTDQRDYAGFNPDFPGERGGSNNSSADNYVQSEGQDDWFELYFKYLLPIGHGRSAPINTYTLDQGLMVSGGTGGDIWNPLKSGRTNIEVMTFGRTRSWLVEDARKEGSTSGMQYALEYDNRDFRSNPSKGSLQRLALTRDFGLFESISPSTVVEADLRKYFSLGKTKTFRQRVLAVDFWTADTPTWKVNQTGEGPVITGRPASYLGATLGGFDRFRAYPQQRFNDKAVIYYCAELRLIPEWNPLGDARWLRFLDIDWWQLVPLVEVGRVAEEWSLGDLHSDMKWDVGCGLRLMAKKAVLRLDTAFSDDSWGMWAMVGHPF
ncbi:MAG: BamA/TamA family outer membrane protein [Deltaproteobacteria bacterium]|nr:BamA/TamA family outer membrane protein [Deltaproteobacteria bacterium]